MDSIDLRSDTVTWPTPKMREAMAYAPVGDDVKGEDPTVNRLEALAAEKLGKEAGLFVSSGTQGNVIAMLTHGQRGDEIIMGKAAHTFVWEVAAHAALGGLTSHLVDVQDDGTLHIDDIRQAIRGKNVHWPDTSVVLLENTQGGRAGTPLTPAYTRDVAAVCEEHDLKLHIDGARIWNAATALDVDIHKLTEPADTVSFCLSKGLCAPVGSVLVGSREFIERARRTRKMLGGGMRQAGILAAAGIIAIEEMTQRLHEDHANARRLAEGLGELEGIQIERPVYSNMVFLSFKHNPLERAQYMKERLQSAYNIKIGSYGTGLGGVRLVTHYWISAEDVETVINAIRHEMTVLA